MGQLTLFKFDDLPYKYIIDTCSILSQKNGEQHDRVIYKSLWQKIEQLMRDKVIVTCSEIEEEVKDDEILLWLHDMQCKIIEIDADIQENVAKVVNEKPELIDFNKTKSSGDAFLIATAIKYNLIIITEESKQSTKKIPQVSSAFNIKSVNVNELCELEGWTF